MSPRSVWPWAVAALAAVVLALWALNSRAPQQDLALEGSLFPELAQRANDIELVTVVGAGEQTLVTLKRESDHWVMPDRDGFSVDASKLRSLLLALTNARRSEPKTANPDLYWRLGVEDVSLADAHGVLLRLSGGGEPLEVIIGQNVTRGTGTYVRIAGEAQSWLLDRNIAVERKPVEWLQRELVNLPTARIESVEVSPAEGSIIEIVRSQDGAGDFQLRSLPKGREPLSEFAADATAGLLDSLRFDDVQSAHDIPDGAELARTTHFETLEGLGIVLSSWRADGKTYATLSATLDEPKAQAWATSVAGPATTDSTGEAADGETNPSDSSGAASIDATDDDRLKVLRAELALLQQRFAGRTFVLPAFKASSLNRGLDEYLKPKD